MVPRYFWLQGDCSWYGDWTYTACSSCVCAFRELNLCMGLSVKMKRTLSSLTSTHQNQMPQHFLWKVLLIALKNLGFWQLWLLTVSSLGRVDLRVTAEWKSCVWPPGKSNVLCLSPAVQRVQPWNLLFLCFSCQVSSWGGYVFLINLIPLHVLVLMLTGRFSHRIYVAYCTVYCLGTILSMQISFVGFQVGNRRIWRYKDGCSSVGCSRTTVNWHLVSLLAFAKEFVSG